MRRNDGNSIQVRGNVLDCRWIVPYNPFLTMWYKAHINTEVCSTITAVKYLYKYVYKGRDRASNIQMGLLMRLVVTWMHDMYLLLRDAGVYMSMICMMRNQTYKGYRYIYLNKIMFFSMIMKICMM